MVYRSINVPLARNTTQPTKAVHLPTCLTISCYDIVSKALIVSTGPSKSFPDSGNCLIQQNVNEVSRCEGHVVVAVSAKSRGRANPFGLPLVIAASLLSWANILRQACDDKLATMSTEKMSPVSKDSTDKMSKKRRREEELAQTKTSETAPEADSTPAKKQKKSKKDRENKVKQEPIEETTKADTSEKKDKKKKKKNEDVQDEETATQDAKPAETAETTEHDNAPEDAEKTKKSKKKKQKEDSINPTKVNGTEDSRPAVSSTTTSATSGKQLQSRAPFIQQTTSFYLALSPIAHQFPLEGLCAEHISPLLLTYYPPMKGVVLSYSDPRMSESPENGVRIKKGKQAKTVLGQSVDEYAVTYVWLTVDLLVFKPQKDTVLEGYVNLQNESILGLICYNYFNAGIERSRIPKDWQWVEDEAPEEGDMSRKGRREAAGHYVNAEGSKVEGKLVFKVKDFEATAGAETGSGSINIYGTLLAGAEDAKADEDVRQSALVRGRSARR